MNKRLMLYLSILALVRIADAFGALLISFVLVAIDRPLTEAQAGLLAGIALAGMLIGAPVMGRLADKAGRRVAISLSILIYAFFTLVSYRAPNYETLLALRFLAGIGIGGVLPTTSTAFIEFVPTERRGFFVCIFESMRAIGTLIVALAAYFAIPRFGRRSMFLIGSLPIVLVPLVLKMPETPFYLASRGLVEEAKRLSESLGLSFDFSALNSNASLRDFLRITILVTIIRFSLAFSYYGRTLRAPRYVKELGFELQKSLSYLIWTSLAMLIGYYVTAFLIERLGRRKLLTIYTLFSAIALYLFALARSYETILLAGLLFAAVNAAARTTTYTYTPELYPTNVRGTAMGIAGAAARIGGFSGPVVIGLTGSFMPLVISLLIASVAAWEIGIETAGKLLN